MITHIPRLARAARPSAIWILAQARDRRRSLLAMARQAPGFAGLRFAATSLQVWRRMRRGNPNDVVLLALDGAPDVREQRAMDEILRACRLVVLAPSSAMDAVHRFEAARSFATLAFEEASVGALQALARTLEGARSHEQRLIATLCERNLSISQARQASARLDSSAQRLSAQWRQVANGAEAEPLRRIASDAVEALAEAGRDIAQSLSGGAPEAFDPEATAVDLNQTIDDAVARFWDETRLPISALTSRTPVLVDASPCALARFLRAIQEAWRARRAPEERWEWIVWDAGESARLAAIVSREPARGMRLPLAVTLRECLTETAALASACGAVLDGPVAAEPDSPRVALTFSLNKRLTAAVSDARQGDLVEAESDTAE